MTRSSSVARSAGFLLTSRLAVAGIALAFLGVSTRLLSIEQMAVFAVYHSLCGVLTVVCSLGLLASCIKLLPGLTAADRRAEAASLLRLAAGVYVAGAATVTVVVWLAAVPISRVFLKTAGFAADVRLAALAALCFGLYEASQLLLAALQRFDRVSRHNVAAALLQRAASLLLFFPFGLKGYLAGFAVGSLTGAVLGARIIAPWMSTAATRGAGSSMGRQVGYAMPFYAEGYLRYLYMHADQVLVGIFLSPQALSVYFIAKRFLQYGQVLVSSLVDPLGTKVAELRQVDPAAVRRAFQTSLRFMVLLFVPLAALMAATSPLLLWLIGGQRYAAGLAPLALLFVSLPFFAVFSLMAALVHALGRPRDRFLTSLASSSAQAAALAGLMPLLGLAGLALARLLGFGVAAAFARRRLARCAEVGPTRPGEWEALRCLPAAAAMVALIVGPHLLMGSVALMPLYALGGIGVCLLGYLRLVLTPEDRSALAGMVPGRGRASRSVRSVLAGPAARDLIS